MKLSPAALQPRLIMPHTLWIPLVESGTTTYNLGVISAYTGTLYVCRVSQHMVVPLNFDFERFWKKTAKNGTQGFSAKAQKE